VDPGHQPQTLAFGADRLAAGLAAWIVEKFRAWTDNTGSPEDAITRDEMLANISLYWFTGAIGSSFWPYYARMHGPGRSRRRDHRGADGLSGNSRRNPEPAARARGAHLRHPPLDADAERRALRSARAAPRRWRARIIAFFSELE
jgi:hypothetical protein